MPGITTPTRSNGAIQKVSISVSLTSSPPTAELFGHVHFITVPLKPHRAWDPANRSAEFAHSTQMPMRSVVLHECTLVAFGLAL